MEARTFNPEILKKSKFLNVSPNAKLLYLYMSCSESTPWGLFEFTEDYLQIMTGVMDSEFDAAMAELRKSGLAKTEDGYILLPDYCPNTMYDPSKSENQKKGLARSLFPLRHLGIAQELILKFSPTLPEEWGMSDGEERTKSKTLKRVVNKIVTKKSPTRTDTNTDVLKG